MTLTEEDSREARYREWRERHDTYLAAIEAKGGTPWTTDEVVPRRLSSTAPKSTEFAVMRYSVSSPPARATIHRGA